MQMRHSLGFQRQQCYGSETQQESYEVHAETWSSMNDHHNHFQGMRMKNGACVDSQDFQKHRGSGSGSGSGSGMFREGHHGYVSGDRDLSFGGAPLFSNHPHHRQLHQGHGRDYFSEMHNGAGKVMVDEMRYDRHNWGGADGFCARPHDRNMNNRFHKVEWKVKGV